MVTTNEIWLEVISRHCSFLCLSDCYLRRTLKGDCRISCTFIEYLVGDFVGILFLVIDRRTDGFLPEDNLEGEIADRAGELGFFSPHSWWPLLVGFFMTLAGLGVLLGWWLTIMAVAGLLISIFGFVMQYQRDKSAH